MRLLPLRMYLVVHKVAHCPSDLVVTGRVATTHGDSALSARATYPYVIGGGSE